jgi:hypothetical protein
MPDNGRKDDNTLALNVVRLVSLATQLIAQITLIVLLNRDDKNGRTYASFHSRLVKRVKKHGGKYLVTQSPCPSLTK